MSKNMIPTLPTGSRRAFLVFIITAGAFVSTLNTTIMAPALPAIMAHFHINAAVGQWMTTINMLVSGVMIPVTAYLINRFSTRQLFFTALGIFLCGTIVCAFSPTYAFLLVGRVIQALGGGVMMPLSAVAVMLVFPKEQRGFALGINGIVLAVGPALGPTLSGWIVDTYSWQNIFYFIAPLSVAVLIVSVFALRDLGQNEATSMDWPSVILSTFAFGGLLLGFSMAGNEGWLSPLTIGPIIGGALILIFYVRRQFRLEKPVLDLSTLKNKEFAISTIMIMILQAGMTIGMVITPIYLQMAHGESALISGLTVLPASALACVLSPIVGWLFDKYGPRQLVIAGLFVTAAGTFMLSFVGTETSLLYITIIYTFRMCGMNLVNMPLAIWGINALPNSLIAHGNAVAGTARMISSSLGTAILITIMLMVQNAHTELSRAAALARGVDVVFAIAAATMAVAIVIALVKVKNERAA